MPSHHEANRAAPRTAVGDTVRVGRGIPQPFGASVVRGGINFAVFSKHADGVTLVLFAPLDDEPALEVRLDPRFHRTGDVWHVMVEGIDPGIEFGWRVSGVAVPPHAFDGRRVLIDPYARALSNGGQWGGPARPRRALIPDAEFDWGFDQPLNTAWADTVIYELHVRGFTRSPSSGVPHAGTFAGIVERIPYLRALGVTAVELMPVTEFDELDAPAERNPETGDRLLNYWGYHPLALFAPKSSYASVPSQVLREFKEMVKALHGAGIEVILDLVFNHTGEGGLTGPTTSFRGLDNSIYYLVDPLTGVYLDFTGCGNTLNCNHPVVRNLIIECLRYWVTEMHVDGFRFDLASVLSRGRDGRVLADPPLLEAIAADPVLAHTKLIAEAWDAAGLYQVGSFPSWGRWAEWNGRFRDDVRRFVRGDAGLAGVIATRLAGSPDLYRLDGRSAHHSVNFVTSHDGFTLRDLVSYDRKHNFGNGEGSRDGTNHNDSWNCGYEGDEGASAAVMRLRRRQARNLLALLFLSRGVPMLLAGDERWRTQGGNNNAYCQDNPISWIDWSETADGESMRAFVSRLLAFRRAHEVLRGSDHYDDPVDGRPAVEWHGRVPFAPDWSEESRLVVLRLHGPRDQADLLIAVNAHWDDVTIALPDPRDGRVWTAVMDTTLEDAWLVAPHWSSAPLVLVEGRSVVVFEARALL